MNCYISQRMLTYNILTYNICMGTNCNFFSSVCTSNSKLQIQWNQEWWQFYIFTCISWLKMHLKCKALQTSSSLSCPGFSHLPYIVDVYIGMVLIKSSTLYFILIINYKINETIKHNFIHWEELQPSSFISSTWPPIQQANWLSPRHCPDTLWVEHCAFGGAPTVSKHPHD